MLRGAVALAGLLMSLALAGCGPDTPASHSRYGLGAYFKDPRAQALAAEQGDAAQRRSPGYDPRDPSSPPHGLLSQHKRLG